jgi:2-oxoglutarate ferredoxin oxidoreductase subunit gamma
MEYAVVMAGFGGQGVLTMGDLLAFSGMKAGYNVTWMPSYGVEMRGGAANCTVVLSKEKIGAPIVGAARAVIAMSEPAFNKFQDRLVPGGLLMVNSSLVPAAETRPERGDVEALFVPARELAEESGDPKMANLTMLGAFLARTGLLELKQVAGAVSAFLPPEKKKLAPGIKKALFKGQEYIASL